jgi:hypothetical protein
MDGGPTLIHLHPIQLLHWRRNCHIVMYPYLGIWPGTSRLLYFATAAVNLFATAAVSAFFRGQPRK